LRRSTGCRERAPLLPGSWYQQATLRVMVLIAAQPIMVSDTAGSRS